MKFQLIALFMISVFAQNDPRRLLYSTGNYAYNGIYTVQQPYMTIPSYNYNYPYMATPYMSTPYMTTPYIYNSSPVIQYQAPYANVYPTNGIYANPYPYATGGIYATRPYATQTNDANQPEGNKANNQCDASCATCSGPSADQCLSCAIGTYPQRIEGRNTLICIPQNQRP